jgi:hypothetical protein
MRVKYHLTCAFSGDNLRSMGKSDFLLLGDACEANASAPLLARDLWHSLSQPGSARRLLPHSRFPLLLLSYADHLELADAVAFAASQLPEAVLVFAPVFLLGKETCLFALSAC